MAKHWVDEGAAYLHVVDLDGAFQGRPVHCDLIRKIVEAVSIPVEAGGGLRLDEDIERVLDCGVQRVVLGTRAWAEPEALGALIATFGASLAVGIDARDGKVQVRGWTETTQEDALVLAQRADRMGLHTLICTDISRDGMMVGTNVDSIDAVCGAVSCDVIASGGVSTTRDMRALRRLERENLVAAIVGKALYEGTVTVAQLQNG